MNYIIISGIDGSGKSYVIQELEKRLQQKGKITYYIWLRYNHYLVKVLHLFARIFGLSVKVKNRMGNVWQHRLYKSHNFCSLYIFCTYIDNLIALYKIKSLPKNIDYILCDRWINDIIIDLATKTHRKTFLDSRWFNRFQKLVPDNSFQFVINRDKDAVLFCRIENQEDPDFEIRYQFYTKLNLKSNIISIDNSSSIENTINQIQLILDK